MENNKHEYYNLKENISILNKIAKQIDMIYDILNTYGIKNMPLGKVKDFLEDRYIKIDSETFEKFDNLIIDKNQLSNNQKDEFLKMFKDTKAE